MIDTPVLRRKELKFLKPACASCAAGFFVAENGEWKEQDGKSPDAGRAVEETGIERDEVIRICLEEHVPIYHGKIDKTLFSAQLQALGALPAQH